jgi:hypothetical protein
MSRSRLAEPGNSMKRLCHTGRNLKLVSRGLALTQVRQTELQSGRGLPHSKTLREVLTPWKVRQLLECGSPLPLFHRIRTPQFHIVLLPGLYHLPRRLIRRRNQSRRD